MTIMTSLAVLGALLPPAAADPCTALPAERVAAVFADAASAAASFSALKQHEGESVSTWAQRLAGDARLSAAFASNGFTAREYLDFGLRVHDAWMAIEGQPTGNTPDPVLLETLRPMAAGFRVLFEGPQSSWPGMVR